MSSAKARRRTKSSDSQQQEAPASSSSSSSGGGPSQESFLAKALKRDAGWDKETFADFLDAVYWLRQIIGLVLGVVWGIIPLTGMAGFVGFGVLNVLLGFLYYSRYAKVDEDDFGQAELMKEGMQSSFGLFLTAWIVTYTLVHHHQQQLAPIAE